MDPGVNLKKENPKKSTNIVSKLFFTWMIQLYRIGGKRGLEIMDLYQTLKEDKSARLGDRLELNWDKEIEKAKRNNREPSLIRAISNTFFWSYMIWGIFLFVQYVGLRSVQPVVLAYLIRLFNEDRKNEEYITEKLYGSGAVLVGLSIIVIFFNHHCNFGQLLVGMRVRIAVSTLVYRKMLRLNKKALGQTAAGQIINLLGNDVMRFDQVAFALHFLWITPFQVALVTYLIWNEVGISCLSGILSMVLFTLPVQGYLGKLSSQYRSEIAVRTDDRVRLMNEIISGIQVIKMYAWEKPFEMMVNAARLHEVKALAKASYLRGVFLSCMVFIERTTLYLTVITYVLLDNVISADKVFSMSQFFNLLQLGLAIFYPTAISLGAETLVSVRRLREFMMLEEREKTDIIRDSEKKGIHLKSVNAAWIENHPTLADFTLTVPEGSLCAVIGPVGAGKSSLLQLLLGELPALTGSITITGEVSYASQETWLFAATVRNNILFGLEYEPKRYAAVTRACALLPDFEQLPHGDGTLVGERGVSLSGGQRARINLARAVYRQADLYLMDDPLSAVDTHVGKHLFDDCIMKYLKGKTRVLVTHQLQFLKKADMIVVINDGKIEAKGTFEELSKSDLDFTKMLIAADETAADSKDGETKQNLESQVSVISKRESIVSKQSTVVEEKQQEQNEEEIGLEGVSASKEYIKAAGSFCVIFWVAFVLIFGQVLCSAADYWVSYWTEKEAEKHVEKKLEYHMSFTGSILYFSQRVFIDGEPQEYINEVYNTITDDLFGDEINTNYAIYVYTGIIVGIIIFTLMRSYLFFNVCMRASRVLHRKMFNALLQAPMRFFDTNPSGRVLNRFSKDIGAVDEALPRVTIESIQIMLVMAGILVMVTISNYYMVIAIVVLGVIFVLLRKWYLRTVRIIKHIEGVAKSPVFSHLNSSLNGITTIRASQAETTLVQQFDKHQDLHTSAWYLTIACSSSFGLWLDMICVVFTAVITFSFILLHEYSDSVSGSMVGLAISQSLILTGMLQHGMRQTAEVVNQLTSVERVLQYTQLDKEGPFDTPKDRKPPSDGWPSQGRVQFQHLHLRYVTGDEPVIRDLNADIKPGEKIGIVGRTGAGKSSLIAALFRLAKLEGSVIVDGLDTATLGLNALRRSISIIPQEPVLFAATLRYNLDPFGEFQDANLWSALEEVELKEAITSLDFMVDEGGSNFSVGQRQLLCLARAILRNNKVLVLDEATANVDPRTDALIQTTIRRKFTDCTVLTIAHRLNTIMDSDRVLVMDAGAMIEFDHPHLLLSDHNGHFSRMVAQTGPVMTAQLREIAENCYLGKKISITKIIADTVEEKEDLVVGERTVNIKEPIEEEKVMDEEEKNEKNGGIINTAFVDDEPDVLSKDKDAVIDNNSLDVNISDKLNETDIKSTVGEHPTKKMTRKFSDVELIFGGVDRTNFILKNGFEPT